MIELIEQHRAELNELCRQYRVKTLEVFGSAADGTWDPQGSDLDFLVDFLPMEPARHSRAYFGLWFAMKELFQHDIDLVETGAVENPYFLFSVNQTREVLYAA